MGKRGFHGRMKGVGAECITSTARATLIRLTHTLRALALRASFAVRSHYVPAVGTFSRLREKGITRMQQALLTIDPSPTSAAKTAQ
jgi:hypothetical protein